jgi:hypothetical protein
MERGPSSAFCCVRTSIIRLRGAHANSAARLQPPNRRLSQTFVFEVEGLRFTATVSRSEDGKPLELFLNNHKHGNQVDTNARDAAIALSFALQCGADAEAIRKALCRDTRYRGRVSGRNIAGERG